MRSADLILFARLLPELNSSTEKELCDPIIFALTLDWMKRRHKWSRWLEKKWGGNFESNNAGLFWQSIEDGFYIRNAG